MSAERAPASLHLTVKVAVLALVAAAVVALGPHPRTSAASPADAVGKVTVSAWVSPWDYSLSAKDGLVALSGGPGQGCPTKLLDPVTLRVVGTTDGCPSSEGPGQVVVDFTSSGDEIRVAIAGHGTHRRALGPVLMTLQNWDWNHSKVAEGDGMTWIYGLNAFGGSRSELLEASSSTGVAVHRWAVEVGADPYLFVDADGLWLTEGTWDGQFCSTACALWHVAPGSDQPVPARRLGAGTQWLVASGHSIWADVLTGKPGGPTALRQAVWRLDGPGARVVFERPARLLPSDLFGGTGYVVEGDPELGFFTLSQLGGGTTPAQIGTCETGSPFRVVRINPSTGVQSYVASLPVSLVGEGLDCHLTAGQSVFTDGALYFLADPGGPGDNQYARVARVEV